MSENDCLVHRDEQEKSKSESIINHMKYNYIIVSKVYAWRFWWVWEERECGRGKGGGGSQNCKLALLIMNKMVDCIIILEDSWPFKYLQTMGELCITFCSKIIFSYMHCIVIVSIFIIERKLLKICIELIILCY